MVRTQNGVDNRLRWSYRAIAVEGSERFSKRLDPSSVSLTISTTPSVEKTSVEPAARPILRGFSGIVRADGLSATVGVFVGLMLAGNAGLTQRWISGSIALMVIAGVGGVTIEDRWVKRLIRADGDEFASILHEKVPFLAAVAGPVVWLFILCLMIESRRKTLAALRSSIESKRGDC